MSIFLNKTDEIKNLINERKLKICVGGVGTVGLPLATHLAKAGFAVIAYDINEERVNQINNGGVEFEYQSQLKEAVTNGKLLATTNAKSAMSESDVIFLCVPTPLDGQNKIDLSKLFSITERVIENFNKGKVVVVESSVTIGTTRKIGKMIEEKTGFKTGQDFGLVYCPERYNPTLSREVHPKVVYDSKDNIYSFTFEKTGRVIGSSDEKSMLIGKLIYSQIISSDITEVPSPEHAEATKLLENIFRDTNIALVNELSIIFQKLGLDIFKVIDAAKSKQFAFLPHYPGVGVGGECIPVDTHYVIGQAEEIGLEPKLLKTVREINNSMPDYTVSLLEQALREKGKSILGSNISILGLAYKKNIRDARLTPARDIAKILQDKGAEVKVCDPLMEGVNTGFDLIPISNAFQNSDGLILVTDHDVFKKIDLKSEFQNMRTPIIIDGRNFFNRELVESLGFLYKGIGKP